MEVHHHPHVGKKNLKEYLLEGLMIFIAVSMGFIAESIREHITDEKQVKEYMREIVENLRYDTVRMNKNTNRNLTICKSLDSFRYEILEARNGNINSNRLYYLQAKSFGYGTVAFNTSAISQLKSSGVLRLVENRDLVDKIDDYYQRRISSAESAKPTSEGFIERQKIISSLFNREYYDKRLNARDGFKPNVPADNGYLLLINPAPKLLRTNPEDFQQLYNNVWLYESGLIAYNNFVIYARELADELIIEIQKEYHLEKE
jgi:hypothetical protein